MKGCHFLTDLSYKSLLICVLPYGYKLLNHVEAVAYQPSSAAPGDDRAGARAADQTLVLSGSFLFFYGFLSSFAPTYVWLLLLRGLVGFCVGAIPQA